jgi:hypothetical protein
MISGLALWFLHLCMDAQNARNSLWPELAESPVIMLTLVSLCATLDQLLLFPDNPLKHLVPRLDAFAMGLGPMACETLAAMSEGDASFDAGDSMPTNREIQQELEEIRAGLNSCIQQLVAWRLTLHPHDGVGFDRRVYATIICCDELIYFDSFPMLGVIRHGLSDVMSAMQAGLAQRNQNTGSAALQGAPRPEPYDPSQ